MQLQGAARFYEKAADIFDSQSGMELTMHEALFKAADCYITCGESKTAFTINDKIVRTNENLYYLFVLYDALLTLVLFMGAFQLEFYNKKGALMSSAIKDLCFKNVLLHVLSQQKGQRIVCCMCDLYNLRA